MSVSLNNFRFQLGGKEYLPIITGGMGVNISTAKLALEIARLGGIGHISDAMSPAMSDKYCGTHFQASKGKEFREFSRLSVKDGLKWSTETTYRASYNYISDTMAAKTGPGAIWVNVMEKLGMGAPRETLKARLEGAIDAGVDGITLSAGLHSSTLPLIEDHPRFRDVSLGVIVSSARALKIFLRSAQRVNRPPDYVIVEGPLAGGHLGFGPDWKKHNLTAIMAEVIELLRGESLSIPVIPAGGVFTGTDAVEFINAGAAAVQVATRFTITRECGLPSNVKQVYLDSQESDIVVNMTSPTGYPMRMLSSSPSLRSNQKPNCESLGYILDGQGRCSYLESYDKTGFDASGKKLPVEDKMCICTHFLKYNCYTCGHFAFRLKETTYKLPSGSFYLPWARDIFNDYLYSVDHQIMLPNVENREVLESTMTSSQSGPSSQSGIESQISDRPRSAVIGF